MMPASIVLPSPTSSARIARPFRSRITLRQARIWCGNCSTPRSESSEISRSVPAQPAQRSASSLRSNRDGVTSCSDCQRSSRRSPCACHERSGDSEGRASVFGALVSTMSQSRCADSRRNWPSNTTSSASRPRASWTSTTSPSPNSGWRSRWPTW
jgi:hypothetical protein